MKKLLGTLLGTGLIIALTVPLGGCPCGFDCSDDDDDNNGGGITFLDLGLSADALADVKAVVITIDTLTLVGSGIDDDVTVETFTIDDLGLVEADTVQVDLLDYIGRNSLGLLDAFEIDAGNYTTVRLALLDGDVNLSYVQEDDDELRELNADGSELSMSGFSLDPGNEAFSFTFSLLQDLHGPDSNDEYLLTTTATRTVDNESDGSLGGRIDDDLFDTASGCDTKELPEEGNRLYLYSELLSSDVAVDAYTADSSTTIPDDAVAPYAAASPVEDSLTGTWQYAFGFLPEGTYTLRFACNAADDDAVEYDEITIPLPEGQDYVIEIEEDEFAACDLAEGASCS